MAVTAGADGQDRQAAAVRSAHLKTTEPQQSAQQRQNCPIVVDYPHADTTSVIHNYQHSAAT